MSSFFDAIYDFSIPSEVTGNPDNTYDVSHYFPFIQNEIAKSINGEPMIFGFQIKKNSRKTYAKVYREKVRQFRESLN